MIFSRALRIVWELRWPLVATHLVVALLTVSVVAPLLSATIATAVSLSGKSGLADFEIATFLLSPVGFVAGLVAASLVLVATVLEVAVMMSVVVAAGQDERAPLRAALAHVLGEMPDLAQFAGRFLLRVLVVVLPVAGLIALLSMPLIGEHDINYYLSERPPEFRRFVLLALGIAIAGGLVLVYLLLGWSMALPAVLFSGTSPQHAFRQSAEAVTGHRLRLLAIFAVWFAVAVAISAVVTGTVAAVTGLLTGWAGDDIARLVRVMALILLFWGTLLAVATTLTRGGFAALLLDRAGALGLPLSIGSGRVLPLGGMVAGLAAAALVVAGGMALSNALMNRVQGDHDVLAVAHRGAAGARPENTLSSIEKAIEDGADWVEIDVQETADGVVIVAHDSDFMKIAGVPTKVWDITAEELAQIDAGGWFAPDFAGEPVPRLADVLALAKGRAKVLIELKYYGHDQMLEDRVAQLVEAADMADSVAVMSLKPEGVAKMRSLRPDWEVGLLAATALGDLTRRDVDFLAVSSGAATPALLARARAAEMPVLVWTVNSAEDISRMISRGVDGVITDFPDRVQRVREARAGLSTVERLLLELTNAAGAPLEKGNAGDAADM